MKFQRFDTVQSAAFFNQWSNLELSIAQKLFFVEKRAALKSINSLDSTDSPGLESSKIVAQVNTQAVRHNGELAMQAV